MPLPSIPTLLPGSAPPVAQIAVDGIGQDLIPALQDSLASLLPALLWLPMLSVLALTALVMLAAMRPLRRGCAVLCLAIGAVLLWPSAGIDGLTLPVYGDAHGQ